LAGGKAVQGGPGNWGVERKVTRNGRIQGGWAAPTKTRLGPDRSSLSPKRKGGFRGGVRHGTARDSLSQGHQGTSKAFDERGWGKKPKKEDNVQIGGSWEQKKSSRRPRSGGFPDKKAGKLGENLARTWDWTTYALGKKKNLTHSCAS